MKTSQERTMYVPKTTSRSKALATGNNDQEEYDNEQKKERRTKILAHCTSILNISEANGLGVRGYISLRGLTFVHHMI